jgi:hypothetical protein
MRMIYKENIAYIVEDNIAEQLCECGYDKLPSGKPLKILRPNDAKQADLVEKVSQPKVTKVATKKTATKKRVAKKSVKKVSKNETEE